MPKLEQLWLLAEDDAESKWTREQAWFILGDLPKRAVSEWEYVEDEFRIELFCKGHWTKKLKKNSLIL